MKKNELMNGDIVVLRSGAIAVVIIQGDDSYLLFKQGGFDYLDLYYDDDMMNESDDDAIMQVFRPDGAFGFEGVDQEIPIYERDETWSRPISEEEARARKAAHARFEAQAAEWRAKAKENRRHFISIISQAFYGNRTGTEIHRENIDRFILGYQSDDLTVTEPIDRTIVHLPGSDKLVLIYNKYQEEESLEHKVRALQKDNYVIKPLATIPEMGVEIYSRCIVCRMNADGEFESLSEDDFEIWDRYLAQ